MNGWLFQLELHILYNQAWIAYGFLNDLSQVEEDPATSRQCQLFGGAGATCGPTGTGS